MRLKMKMIKTMALAWLSACSLASQTGSVGANGGPSSTFSISPVYETVTVTKTARVVETTTETQWAPGRNVKSVLNMEIANRIEVVEPVEPPEITVTAAAETGFRFEQLASEDQRQYAQRVELELKRWMGPIASGSRESQTEPSERTQWSEQLGTPTESQKESQTESQVESQVGSQPEEPEETESESGFTPKVEVQTGSEALKPSAIQTLPWWKEYMANTSGIGNSTITTATTGTKIGTTTTTPTGTPRWDRHLLRLFSGTHHVLPSLASLSIVALTLI